MKPVILALPDNTDIASALVTRRNAELGQATVRRFPDGESYVRIDIPVARRRIILIDTLDRPDDKILLLRRVP
ncbi:MAG: ribose-phosphate pyrophosphokinase-like domain-containing protein [Nitrososphaera sp.]|nr:ribose-phosphate pyrophosphokinase-like domain-containing protein [Nitrososphaera sp.]